jgi:hypothetical protein
MEWFRWYKGTVTDAKFAGIARRVKQPKAIIVAVWAMLLESASEGEGDERGTIKHSVDDIAGCLDLDTEVVETVLNEMGGRGMLAAGRMTAWDRRQFKSDDVSSRVRSHRERKRGGNGDETPRNVTVTPPETDTDTDIPSPSGDERVAAPAAPPAVDPIATDPKLVVFGDVLAWLRSLSGKSEQSIRSFLGKCCAEYGDGNVIVATSRLRSRDPPIDPFSALKAELEAMRGKGNGKSGRTKESVDEQRERRRAGLVAAVMAAELGSGGPGAGPESGAGRDHFAGGGGAPAG